MTARDWNTYTRCPADGCGFLTYAPFGNARMAIHAGHFVRRCPQCGGGGPPDLGDWVSARWPIVIRRWVDTGTWWKPWTWGRGYWEERP